MYHYNYILLFAFEKEKYVSEEREKYIYNYKHSKFNSLVLSYYDDQRGPSDPCTFDKTSIQFFLLRSPQRTFRFGTALAGRKRLL